MTAPAVLGLVLLLSGLSILGWAGWQYFGTNITSRQQAQKATDQMRQQWARQGAAKAGATPSAGATPAASATPSAGEGIAILRIPAFGDDWAYPVLTGTDPDTLARGIGWYPSTARPGAVGNFAVAGHRVTHGEPFRRLLELNKGAKVVVETADAVYTYQLDSPAGTLTVADTEGWVLDPVPGRPGQQPTKALITLTTCQDLFHSPDRSVAFGHLVETKKK